MGHFFFFSQTGNADPPEKKNRKYGCVDETQVQAKCWLIKKDGVWG